MKLKNTKMATLAATLITFGSLAGGAYGDLLLTADDDVNGNLVITLVGTDFTTVGLTPASDRDRTIVTFANLAPSRAESESESIVAFTGDTDTLTKFDTPFEIPEFFTGLFPSNISGASNLSGNPFIVLFGFNGNHGGGVLFTRSDSPLPSNFTASATYIGASVASFGWDKTPQEITFSNGQVLFINRPPTIPTIPTITTFGLQGDFIVLNAVNLIPTQFYKLERSTDLENWIEIENGRTGAEENFFTDAAPPTEKAFYRVVAQ